MIVTNQTVGSVVVTSSARSAPVGQMITFTATVTGNSPTGNVQFSDGGVNPELR